MLADDRVAESGRPAAIGGGSVPSVIDAGSPAVPNADDGDDADTFPLPVILPGVSTTPRSEPAEAVRGPFEPARPSSPAGGPADLALADPARGIAAPDESGTVGNGRDMPSAAEEKLDQIKDLLLMAEAIGDQNLDRHFDRVSQRQRELIREFFDRAVPGEPDA